MERLQSDYYRYLYLILSDRYSVLQLKKAKLNLKFPSDLFSHIDNEMKIVSNILESFEESDFSDD